MEESKKINISLCKLPVNTSLSFEWLIKELSIIGTTESNPMQKMAHELLTKLDKTPELRNSISDNSILEKHATLIKQLMAFIFSPLHDDTEISAAFSPFTVDPIYATGLYNKTIAPDHRKLELAEKIEQHQVEAYMMYQAYLFIFDKLYNVRISDDLPFTFKLIDEKDSSVKFFKKRFNTKYLNIKLPKNAKLLSPEDIKELFDNADNLEFWQKKIPLNEFEFSGFVQFSYIDVTHDYVISQMKSDLLDKSTIVTQAGFEKIRKRMRALFENPRLEFGMAVAPDQDATLNSNLVWNTIVPRSELKCEDYAGTIYEKAFEENRIIISSDIQTLESDPVIDAFRKKGIRSHAVVPLVLDGKPMGMLEFACLSADNISMLQIKRLHDVFPTFALALQRSKEEWNDRIRAVIQDEFTAIHPTVEWRFREAVMHLLANAQEGEKSTVEPIVFPDIVPIYGASDIRGSSVERNKGIQSDLTEQLEHAQQILEHGMQIKEMPLLDDINFKINEYINTVKNGLKAGDEVVIIDFLKRDVDPLLLLLKLRYPEIVEQVEKYFDSLDPELHVLYRKRKDFEDSLTMINDKVSEIIDSEQAKAQDVFPHYFEKYRTDGVEYNAYIGQSLVKDLEYDEIYLKNIRLWQLLVKVKVARKIKALQAEMPTKLDITQLILVHSNPLSIAFRQDEKKFDVAGAYNIRYEITKKRIDKALINGTNERVTQVGKIAIIYSHADEIREYRKYIDYMVAQGFLKPTVEDLELEDLTGASGLRALRVEVDFSDLTPNNINPAEIEEVVSRN